MRYRCTLRPAATMSLLGAYIGTKARINYYMYEVDFAGRVIIRGLGLTTCEPGKITFE
jgi:hypothetical protein